MEKLPEEIIQHIWKFIYNDNFKDIHNYNLDYTVDIPFIRVTTKLEKKTGHYHDILKEKYNVVIFGRKWNNWTFEKYEEYLDRKQNCHSNGLINTNFCWKYFDNKLPEKMWRNQLRIDKFCYTMAFLQFMLENNGYVLRKPHTYTSKKQYYKSWTRDRLIKELMSF